MPASVTQQISDWACGPMVANLPEPATNVVKRALLDTMAVTLLGSRLEAPRIVARIEFARGAAAAISVCGMGRKADVLGAALINGISAHADLFDDNNAPMIAHPSSPLVSCLLPLAQSRGLGGRAVIQAYAAGFEVGVTLGRLLNPALYEQGWHVTRVLGVIGSTAACCRLIGLDPRRTASALGIAVSMASSVRQNFGTMTMALHVGLTARDAVHCALLAEAGFESDPNAMDGKYGFSQVFAGRALDTLELGSHWELLTSGIIFKPYPCGAPTHAAVDAALALRVRIGGDAAGIASLECMVHPWNAMTLRTEDPRDTLQARVNLKYCVAAALLHGELGFQQFSDHALADPALRALMQKISVRIADDLPDNGEFPAEVRLQTSDGQWLVERREVPPGGSTRPLGAAQIEAKFRSCSQLVLDRAAADRVLQAVNRFEDLDDLDPLCEWLEGRAQPAR